MAKFQGKIRQKKSFGQVFLKDEWPCAKIVDVLKQMNVDTVLEIGPGGAALTHKLLDAGFKVTSVEKDHRFAERLENLRDVVNVTSENQFEIINEDILKFNMDQWIKSAPGKIAVCGNIPYNISTPILEILLPRLGKIKGAVLMVQKEFGERVAANSGVKNYGSLSVFAQLRSIVKLEFLVERTCFSPIPAVDSVVISLRPNPQQYPEKVLKETEKVTRMAFSQRRKKLSNALSKLELDHGALGIDMNRRPETLSPQEYVKIASQVVDSRSE